jgi:hypothetical protein
MSYIIVQPQALGYITQEFGPPVIKQHKVNGILLEVPPGSTYPDFYPMYYDTLVRGVGSLAKLSNNSNKYVDTNI